MTPHLTRTRRRVMATCAVACLAAASACGDDDDTASSVASAPAATAPAAADSSTTAGSQAPASTVAEAGGAPVKIGLLGAITGPSSTGQRTLDKVAAAWETWVNENGGIAGQPVEVVFKDSANDAAKTQAAAKELVEQDQVVAVVLADGTTEDAVGPYLNEQRMPVVGGFGFSSNVWGKLDNFFTLKTDVMAIVAGPILAADVVGATTFAAVVCSENPSCAQAEQLYQSLIPSIGIGYAGLATAAFSEPSYTAQCLALMAKGADYIQINLTSDGATRLITDCVRQGYTGTFGLADGTVLASAMADTPAEAKVFGVIDGFPWWVQDGPAADFHAAMDAAALTEDDYGNSSYTALWSSLETFRAAMAGAPANPTSADVFDAMYALEDEDLGGLLPQKMNFEAGQPAPPVNCFWYYEYTDGEFAAFQDESPSGNSVTEGELKTACYGTGA